MQHETRVAIRNAFKLSLAHHPLCAWFQGDVFGRRVRVCSGCALTWPLFFISAVVATLWILKGASPAWVMAWGALGGVPQASTLVYRGGRIWRATVKVVGGVGLGMLVAGFLHAPMDHGTKLAWASLFSLAVVGFLLLRLRSIVKICDACPWQRDWEHCPGFGMQEMLWAPVDGAESERF